MRMERAVVLVVLLCEHQIARAHACQRLRLRLAGEKRGGGREGEGRGGGTRFAQGNQQRCKYLVCYSWTACQEAGPSRCSLKSCVGAYVPQDCGAREASWRHWLLSRS